jgi:hypothetical protein
LGIDNPGDMDTVNSETFEILCKVMGGAKELHSLAQALQMVKNMGYGKVCVTFIEGRPDIISHEFTQKLAKLGKPSC